MFYDQEPLSREREKMYEMNTLWDIIWVRMSRLVTMYTPALSAKLGYPEVVRV